MSDNHDFNSRLSRLETLVENLLSAIGEIKVKLSEEGKINWAPIAIGVTIFFTVCGSVATIYNTRISTLNTAVEQLGNRTLDIEKANVERTIKVQTLEQRMNQVDKDLDDIKYDNHTRQRDRDRDDRDSNPD
jgi:exonuclease VII small subunit